MNLARMTSCSDNLDDVFSRLWMYASPYIRCQKPKGRKRRGTKQPLVPSSTDEIVESFFVDTM